MPEFTRYPCWDPDVAARTISTEAVSPSPAVFFATHAPLRIYRGPAEGTPAADRGQPVDEDTVRRDFLNRPTAQGVLLMPVIGDTGTGKSHLVRWIKERTPSTESRHVIYLPKLGTSMKAVVTGLLAGVQGSQFDALRTDVNAMDSQLDQAGLEQRLLNYLQEALTAAQAPAGPARVLVGPKGLAVLLLDPHVREHLLQNGRLIPRLAQHLLADRRQGDPERPLSFTIDDLPLTVAKVDYASEAAKRLLGVITFRDDLQAAAVQMLNEHLNMAVMSATNLGVGRLQQAMLDIRREFAQQGKEIVLLIEDFALIQGVQRDLLEAVIEAGVRDGRTVLAPVRTLLAVTTGYYGRLVDTVLSRARAATPYVYDLDTQFDNSEQGIDDILSFAGRYLNAARLGQESLDKAGVHDAAAVENFCHSCPMIADCHAGFGKTVQDHGLYPFNRAALLRAIHSQAPHDKPHAFNPRAILGQVLRNVLVEHAAAIREGSFPDSRFRQEYPTAAIDTALPSAVSNAIDDADAATAERRATLLEFWGDAPQHLTNLAPEVHLAFDLPMLDIEEQPTTTTGPSRQRKDKPSPKTPDAATDLPASVRKAIEEIEDWQSRGAVLPQQTAAEIRTLVAEAVARRCQWNDPLLPEPSESFLRTRAWPAKSTIVSIDGAAAQGLAGTAGAPIKFSRTPRNAVFFRGLLEAKAGRTVGNGEHIRRLYDIAERHQRELVARVQAAQGTSDAELVFAVRAALIGAALAGAAYPGMTDGQLLNAILDEGRTWTRADEATRTAQWTQTLTQHQIARPELIAGIRSGFGIRRGVTGETRMIDAARAVPLLRRAVDGWTWSTPDIELPNWAKKAVTRFADWDSLVAAQAQHLAAQVSHLRTLLPKGAPPRDTVRAVADAIEAGTLIGHVPGDIDAFRRMVSAAADLNWKTIEQLERDLERATAADHDAHRNLPLLVAVAAKDWGRSLSDALDFLQRSDAWLTEALDMTQLREGAMDTDATGAVADLLQEWGKIREGTSQ